MVLTLKKIVDQWNRIGDLDLNPHIQSHLSFDNDVNNTHWRRGNIHSKWYSSDWIIACIIKKVDPHLHLT